MTLTYKVDLVMVRKMNRQVTYSYQTSFFRKLSRENKHTQKNDCIVCGEVESSIPRMDQPNRILATPLNATVNDRSFVSCIVHAYL